MTQQAASPLSTASQPLRLASPDEMDGGFTLTALPSELCNLRDETHDTAVLDHVAASDAWDCLVLPLRMQDGCLVVAVAEETFDEARALLESTLSIPVIYKRVNLHTLEQFIAQRYQYEGLSIDD